VVISIAPDTYRVAIPAAAYSPARSEFVSQSLPALVCSVASGPFIAPV
jgi:hypothetical protein